MQYLSYEQAKEFVSKLGLKGKKEWFEYIKSGNRPDDIPYSPYYSYENKGWISWGDFLGKGLKDSKNINYLSYEEAKEFVSKLKIKSRKEWQEYVKSGNKPNNIPSNLDKIYKNKGWNNWGDFLGTGNIHAKYREYLSYKEAKEFVSKLDLKNQTEWYQYTKSGNKPNEIPVDPSKTYENKGWISWGDFLGKGLKDSKNINWLSYEEARKFVMKLGFKTQKEWFEYCKSGNKPDNIPANPYGVYKLKK
jgi:hypothetical protein